MQREELVENIFWSSWRVYRCANCSAGSDAALVAGLPSDTVDAPRNLSASLLSRLGEIADHHNGMCLCRAICLQWLHPAYPLECQYPHAAGTTSPLTQDEWTEHTGAEDISAPEDERVRIAKLAKPTERAAELPWRQLE